MPETNTTIDVNGVRFSMDPMTATGHQIASIRDSLNLGKEIRQVQTEAERAKIRAAKALNDGLETRTLANTVCGQAANTLDHLPGLIMATTGRLDPKVYDLDGIIGEEIERVVGCSLEALGIDIEKYRLPQPTTTPVTQP